VFSRIPNRSLSVASLRFVFVSYLPTCVGLGTVRNVQQFFDIYGIHVPQKTVEHKLCTFVNAGPMHPLFVQHLRLDGMGIDYTKIQYKFQDPTPKKDKEEEEEEEE
jgi:hypothetical protein